MVIGNHRRFAVRRVVTLAESGSGNRRGLLFELSLSGCRVSNLSGQDFDEDESVKIHVPGFGELEGRVRRARDGAIALRYARPLHTSVLDHLLYVCRQGDEAPAGALSAAG
ncbi:MAG: PilZ domain-containing protein [Novosphingobium sp.]